MKYTAIYFILSLLISNFASANHETLSSTLPEGVDYKVQVTKGRELHLFRLAEHPIDKEHWGPDLPILIMMRMEASDYTKAVRSFKGEDQG